jgi:hypothetical protein
VTGKLRGLRHYAYFFLFLEDFFSVSFPTVVELPFVFVSPFFGDMVGSMHCTSAEVHEERFVWGDLFSVGDKGDGYVYQVFS